MRSSKVLRQEIKQEDNKQIGRITSRFELGFPSNSASNSRLRKCKIIVYDKAHLQIEDGWRQDKVRQVSADKHAPLVISNLTLENSIYHSSTCCVSLSNHLMHAMPFFR